MSGTFLLHRNSNNILSVGFNNILSLLEYRNKKRALCVGAPADMVAYVWNQWLKTSSMSRARKPQYQRRFSMPRMASRPAVDSLKQGPTQAVSCRMHTRQITKTAWKAEAYWHGCPSSVRGGLDRTA